MDPGTPRHFFKVAKEGYFWDCRKWHCPFCDEWEVVRDIRPQANFQGYTCVGCDVTMGNMGFKDPGDSESEASEEEGEVVWDACWGNVKLRKW